MLRVDAVWSYESPAGRRPDPGQPLRPEVASAWRRTVLSGVAPYKVLLALTVSDVDLQSRLVLAAEPIVDQLEDELSEAGFGR